MASLCFEQNFSSNPPGGLRGVETYIVHTRGLRGIEAYKVNNRGVGVLRPTYILVVHTIGGSGM